MGEPTRETKFTLKGKKMMLRRDILVEYTKIEITSLEGGRKRVRKYFVGILDKETSEDFAEIYEMRLLQKMVSKKSPSPEGFELFQKFPGCAWTPKLDLRTMRMGVPRLCCYDWANFVPSMVGERAPVRIIRSGRSVEEDRLLRREADRSAMKHQIRRAAAQDFNLVSKILAYAGAPACSDPVRSFEAILGVQDWASLRDLCALLEMPETCPTPHASSAHARPSL